MKSVFQKIATVLGLGLSMGLASNNLQAAAINPFDFNVYSLGDIGLISSGYGSDFQGTAAAAGNAYFSGFSLNDLNATPVVPGFSLHTGGDVVIQGSINNGGVDAGGSVYVNYADINGNIVAGGNLNGLGGTVYGNTTLGGTDNTTLSVTVTGSITQNTSYVGSLDFTGINQYLTDYSTNIGSQTDTTSYTNNYGELLINVASGDNYVTINASELNSSWGVTITGDADAVLYINVDETDVDLDSTNWVYNGGITADDVLLNFANATDIDLTGGNTINILAPLADVNFANGLVTGNLITGNLTGGGQVNLGGFSHSAVPEPSSALALIAGSMAMLIGRRKRNRSC